MRGTEGAGRLRASWKRSIAKSSDFAYNALPSSINLHCMKKENSDMKMDAVIVLANLMDTSGILNLESAARAEKSVEVFNQLQAGTLVTCGWAYRADSDITIADALKSHIVSRYGIPSERIIAEKRSRDTVGDAYFTKALLALTNRWKNITVVTSNYHVERVKEIFSFIYGADFYIAVVGAEVPQDESILSNERKSLEAFRSTFSGVRQGEDAEILGRLRERHPFYNGVIYPTI